MAFRQVSLRPNRRRFSADNTRGRSDRIKDLIQELRKRKTDRKAAQTFFASLHPRDKLDVLKRLHSKQHRPKHSSTLPRYFSGSFHCFYYFREEDLEERSTLGRGPGGQATNRRKQTVILHHVPTNLSVKVTHFPSLRLNRRSAREKLHLRLEEYHLGEASYLGKLRAMRERKREQHGSVISNLAIRGAVLASKQSKEEQVHDFLIGECALPYFIVVEYDKHTAPTPRKWFIRSILDEEYGSLWSILSSAYTSLENPPLLGGATVMVVNKEVQVSLALYHLPGVLRFIFPLYEGDGAKHREQQLLLCRKNPSAISTVQLLFRSFVEMFGLRLHNQTSRGTARSTLVKDGANWYQMRHRLLTPDGALTHIAGAMWTHVIRSLNDLQLMKEKRAALRFLVKLLQKSNPSSLPPLTSADHLQKTSSHDVEANSASP